MADNGDISELLRAWGRGSSTARERLLPLVYGELKRRAAAQLRHETPAQSLQATALVHEAYLRLIGQQRVAWQNRAHFFGIAAQLMRRIIVDAARARHASKRGGDAVRVAFDEDVPGRAAPVDVEVIALDIALEDLARLDPRQAQIVEMRYFAGMSESEVAIALSISRATATREWQTARAWLHRYLTKGRP